MKDKPRVLFLVTEDWYFCLHRLSLAKVLRDHGYEVVVATRVREHGLPITAEGFRLINIRLLRSSRNPFADLLAIAELVRIYRNEKPALLHHIGMKPIVYGSWAARITGHRVVVNAFAGLGFVFEGSKWSKRILRAFVVLLLRTAFADKSTGAMFENTEDYEALWSRGIVTRERSAVVRGAGVDENIFAPVPEAPGEPIVLLASRMVWLKGIGEFVEAARIIRGRGIRARFVLAGRRDPDNPTSISLKQLQEWQDASLVEWWGQRDDMPDVIAQSHVVALPSWIEGLPRALLEAASCTRAIVGTDISGNREIIRDGENGFLVPLKNPAALAEALIKLIENPDLRRRMGECGRRMVLESLTERHVFAQVLQFYGKLLKPSQSEMPIPGMTPEIQSTSGCLKPRVLFLVTEDWYFCLHRLSLGRAVRDSGYDVIVATHVADHGAMITAEGFKLIPIGLSRESRNPFADLLAVLELARIYRRERPDIVHHVALKPILYGSWAARLARQRIVVNAFAGLGFVFTGMKWPTRFARSIISFLLRSAFTGNSTLAIFQNADDCEALRSRGVVKLQNTAIIRGSGVEVDEFTPSPEAPGDPIVLLAGRMLWDKGIGEFVEAAAIIKRRGINAKFVLAGRRDPSNPSSISEAQLGEWQVGGIVEWWGQRDDMPQVMAQAHIVALPSYREGLPKALLEAAACSRPVVATDVPGCREIVKNGENGFLVPARNPVALADALISLIENPALRRQMGERGRQLVEEALTVRHVTSQFLEVYARLLRETGSASHR